MFDWLTNFLNRFPSFKDFLRKISFTFSNKPDFTYPRGSQKEIHTLKKVLYSGNWNATYSPAGMHVQLEKAIADYIGVSDAVAVNTGGMALQLIFRALNLSPDDEVIHQVDTCTATALAIMNSFASPAFCDSDLNSFSVNEEDLKRNINSRTKIILPVHLWGNADDMDMIHRVANENNLTVVEDGCLSLGASWKNKKVGSFGVASAFSFGCLKPVQAGEGGIIVTNDSTLAKELRTLRNWGQQESLNFGSGRPTTSLPSNGRISEFAATVAYTQFMQYEDYLKSLREHVEKFSIYLNSIAGLKLHSQKESVFTQVVLKIDDSVFPLTKQQLLQQLNSAGISCSDANFEPINQTTFFKEGHWKKWNFSRHQEELKANYSKSFPNANQIYKTAGIGIHKSHFINSKNYNDFIKKLDRALK